LRRENQVIISKNGLELTKEFEGCKLVSYLDSGGVWTIGYGHTNGIKRYMECTQDQADEWLLSDIQSAQDDVNKLVKVSLTQTSLMHLSRSPLTLVIGA